MSMARFQDVAMSNYVLQKTIRDINRDPHVRSSFLDDASAFTERIDLTPAERNALVARNYKVLYQLGVHGLLLRPFSLLHGVKEDDYLNAIRELN
jgi:hypothetical protein